MKDGLDLVEEIGCDGLLIDTYRKDIGKGLLDYVTLDDLRAFVDRLHDLGKEAWLAGSLAFDDLTGLWQTGVDVICVRGAACEPTGGLERFGEVKAEIVARLVSTIPKP